MPSSSICCIFNITFKIFLSLRLSCSSKISGSFLALDLVMPAVPGRPQCLTKGPFHVFQSFSWIALIRESADILLDLVGLTTTEEYLFSSPSGRGSASGLHSGCTVFSISLDSCSIYKSLNLVTNLKLF